MNVSFNREIADLPKFDFAPRLGLEEPLNILSTGPRRVVESRLDPYDGTDYS